MLSKCTRNLCYFSIGGLTWHQGSSDQVNFRSPQHRESSVVLVLSCDPGSVFRKLALTEAHTGVWHSGIATHVSNPYNKDCKYFFWYLLVLSVSHESPNDPFMDFG